MKSLFLFQHCKILFLTKKAHFQKPRVPKVATFGGNSILLYWSEFHAGYYCTELGRRILLYWSCFHAETLVCSTEAKLRCNVLCHEKSLSSQHCKILFLTKKAHFQKPESAESSHFRHRVRKIILRRKNRCYQTA